MALLSELFQWLGEVVGLGRIAVKFDVGGIRKNTKDGSSSKTDDEENCALEIKTNKGKGKDSHSKLDSYHGGNKKDMMKVKGFHCHELGHFATNCPLKKSKKTSSGQEAGESLASQFELDFPPLHPWCHQLWELYST